MFLEQFQIQNSIQKQQNICYQIRKKTNQLWPISANLGNFYRTIQVHIYYKLQNKKNIQMEKYSSRRAPLLQNISHRASAELSQMDGIKREHKRRMKSQEEIQQSGRVPILDYINIIKTTSSRKQNTNNYYVASRPRILQYKKPEIQKNMRRRMSQIVLKRRNLKLSSEHKDIDLYRRCGLNEVVEAIMGCYEYYQKFGYSLNKITSTVKCLCKSKKDLQWILMRKTKNELDFSEFVYEHRTKSQDIMNRLMRTIISKPQHQKSQLIKDFLNFKICLQQDIADKSKGRIKQIKNFITVQKKQLDQRIQFINQNCRFVKPTKIYHRSLPSEQLRMAVGIDEFSNAFRSQLKVNRMIYKHFITLD